MSENRIMFVDDERNVLRAYSRILRTQRQEWNLLFHESPLEAWQELRQTSVDVVVSDINMPGLTGLELLRRMKGDVLLRDIPVIIVTGRHDEGLKSEALTLGATDLLPKPVDCNELMARLRNALHMKQCTDQLKEQNETLDLLVQKRTQELLQSHSEVVWRLAKAAECRDDDTGNHVVRVGLYSKLIGSAMGLDDAYCETLFLAATLHDIGKIGIPDSILRKPGKLTPQERKTMEEHCVIGRSILADGHTGYSLLQTSGNRESPFGPNPLLRMAADIATYHHERWDGTGYPYGLHGEEIPLTARIVAIADVFDALRSLRPYKPAFEIERALDIIAEREGTQFDPEVYQAFLQVLDEILETELTYSDTTNSLQNKCQVLQR